MSFYTKKKVPALHTRSESLSVSVDVSMCFSLSVTLCPVSVPASACVSGVVLLCVCVSYTYKRKNIKHAGGKMFVVLVMSYAPDGDLFSKLERAHKEQRHIPEEVCVCVK
jgi:hypothetical protein